MSCVAHWFLRRRGLVNGIIFIGSGSGGIVFPLMIQALIPEIGWAWSIRIMGFVLMVLCAFSIAFCRSRIPPRKGSAVSWKDTLPDIQIFFDGTGAMTLTTLGVLLVDLAYFIPVTYVPSYYLARQNLSSTEALSGAAAFAYQLLAVLNAASCFGRVAAGHYGDVFGPYNVMIVSLVGCIVSVMAFWLPDILVADLQNNAVLIVFVALFGFVSGSNVSLTPVCLAQLCDVRDYGRYYASCYTVVSLGVLVSLPIAGGLLDAVHVTGKEMYWGVALFTGLTHVASLACFMWVRIVVKGWDWRTRW
jgi:MFS family permease